MNKYTSFELSKKLSENGCILKGSVNCDNLHEKAYIKGKDYETYMSYDILWDICIKYPKEFFGDNHLELANQLFKIVANPCSQQTIEYFIWENCLFNPKNKGVK